MAKLSHQLEYIAARILKGLVTVMSASAADRFGRGMGTIGYYLLSKRRDIALENLQHATCVDLTDEEKLGVIENVFQNICHTYIDLARFKKLGHEGLKRIVSGNAEPYLEEINNYGKGGIVVSAHFGNWELQASWVNALGYKLDGIAKTQSNPLINDLVQQLRREMHVTVIQSRRGNLREIFKSLQQKRLVMIVADQHDPSGNLILDFFGRPAAIAKGPAAFAVRFDCPLMPLLMRREAYDRHVITAAKPIYPPQSGDVEKDIIDMTKEYLRFFEEVIATYPDQWLWTHRRWKV